MLSAPRPPAGLANLKTVGIDAVAGEKLRLALSKSQAKRANKPSKKVKASVMAASSGRKVCKAVAADVAKYRPDLVVRPRPHGRRATPAGLHAARRRIGAARTLLCAGARCTACDAAR